MSEITLNFNSNRTQILLSWINLSNQSKLTSFLSSEFSECSILNQTISIPYGVFLASRNNFDHFLLLNDDLRQIINVSKDIRLSIEAFTTYKYSIENFESVEESTIQHKLEESGFKRNLKWFQLRNLSKMLGYPSVADFSVPGAGKTTEALAFYLLKRKKKSDRVLIISPINAFTAWEEDLPLCIEGEKVIRLKGSISDIKKLLKKDNNFFITNYEFVRSNPEFLELIAVELLGHSHEYFMILDESHRMKGTQTSRILSYLSPLSKNKLLLTGTPMPQEAQDLQPQFNFLYPDENIFNSQLLLKKFQPIYVRTTKKDMNRDEITLPRLVEKIQKVEMLPAQKEFYSYLIKSILREEWNLQDDLQLKAFKKAVMRLLQFSSNPLLQLPAISKIDLGLANRIQSEGLGPKMERLVDDVNLITDNEKVIVWSSFPRNINYLKGQFSYQNAVTIKGGMPYGKKDDPETREYAIDQFKNNDYCRVFIANPMAAGEGINLQNASRKAFYLDRTYNLAQYLQSRDRIHRIGSDVTREVEIIIYQLSGTVDLDVHVALERKLTNMSKFLDDPSILSNTQTLDADEDTEAEMAITDLRSALEFLNG